MKPNSYSHLKEELDYSLMEPLTVKCIVCNKHFNIKVQFEALPLIFKGQGKCICDPSEWRNNKPRPVCDNFVMSQEGNCEICEHDEECH